MIHLDSISYSYDKKENILDRLDLSLLPGNIYGLLGKNGNGKSTLLKLIMGHLVPDKGVSLVCGHNSRLRLPSTLEEIFYISDELPNHRCSVSAYADKVGAFYQRFDKVQFADLLTLFGLDKDKKLSQLSKGQLKIVFVCLGLSANTKILVLDEATDGLDIEAKQMLKKVLVHNFSEEKLFLISTHQVQDIENIIDRVLILEHKQIIIDHSLADISGKFKTMLIPRSNREIPEFVLYSEDTYKGKIAVVENNGDEEFTIELELFYKAYLANKEKIHSIFKKKIMP